MNLLLHSWSAMSTIRSLPSFVRSMTANATIRAFASPTMAHADRDDAAAVSIKCLEAKKVRFVWRSLTTKPYLKASRSAARQAPSRAETPRASS